MAVKSNSELAAFFQTGDQPSQTEFGHLIDTIQPSIVYLSDANDSLTAAEHGFRTCIMPDIEGSNKTLTLPTSFSADSVWFHLLYFGDLSDADSHNWIIETGTANTHFFHGAIFHHDTDADSSGGALNVIAHGNGSSNDVISLTTGYCADIWIHARSTTVWNVWGHSAGATPITIADS